MGTVTGSVCLPDSEAVRMELAAREVGGAASGHDG